MKLTLAQRTELFAGQPTKITFAGSSPCPVEPGHVETLSEHVWLEVTDIRRTKSGDHSLVYTLHNNRLGQRFLASQDGQLHPEQYNHSGGSNVDPEAGEAVDEFTQRRITEAAWEADKQSVGEMLVVLQDLRAAVSERLENNPDAVRIMGRDAWALRKKIDGIERRMKQRHAA